ncbi:retron system putative HNH endonuclease [Providencia alcalifaciens]|uniref:retron system putative HNH endonuclease n=1 Tax=Providencia alcalifaciens TaxID=126385 RepID=UPI002B054A4F|nr:retron system putative HNH endonuclease [Providencia alcalifaciens]
MHKLDRSGVEPPESLADYDYRIQKWRNLASDCKNSLRAALVQMQGKPDVTTSDANEYGVRCAYCEGAIYHKGHIEHFRRKNANHFPQLTFVWENLFLACGSNEHCGHYKDRKGASYNPNNLIKPDEHDPDSYLYFHSTGEVLPRANIDENSRFCATETIRVFGLNSAALSGARSQVLSVYKKRVIGDIEELASWSEEERDAYFAYEIEETRWEPYSTTIKHFLQNYI